MAVRPRAVEMLDVIDMKLVSTPLGGVMVASTDIHSDARGSFARFFCEDDLASALGDRRIVQINHSRTAHRGAVRGLHYQLAPYAETKFVRCLRGAAWDVVVDLRAGSSTFLRWHAVEITAENGSMVVIPEGCAHGFQALTADSELLYLHTACFTPAAEAGIAWNDVRLNIAWPLSLPEAGGLSERDRLLPRLGADFAGLPG
jgi:dTDP-4-dehydrorhamnose 3,5-epimerase